ncbi:ankyrin [Lepidopterella palustris CBS 459.81]|uniref:Ankyrin n=1 Tax=Lepidopterella palustris CBS 459.81 TaxID=1314670 RepID=A0A8E2JFR3_9PEZI|nr:ankyrin [Lepidopterella palustris CBS 459.81]
MRPANFEYIQPALDAGSDVNSPGHGMGARTPIQVAAEVGNLDLLIEFLLAYGADVNADAGIDGGLTALQGAAIQGHMKLALLLLDAGADVNGDPAPIEGRTALDGAAEHGRLDMVQFLLNAKAMGDKEGKSRYDRAVGLAEENGHFAVVELLKSHSAGLE